MNHLHLPITLGQISEGNLTLATCHALFRNHFNHPAVIMNFTLFERCKAATDGLSTLLNYWPSHLSQKHQASNWPLQTRFPSWQYTAVDSKIFDTRRSLFVPEVQRCLQDYCEVYLDVESNSTELSDGGRVSPVAHNNYNELEKLLFKQKRFYLKPYELDHSQTEAKTSPPTAIPWAKQLQPLLDKTKEENKDLRGWFDGRSSGGRHFSHF